MENLVIKIDTENREQQKAFDIVANTNNCLFITGKAGTGKTTFVKRLLEEVDKNFLVLAPTGIAALAVGGQTIHSFFGFPLDVIGPHTHLSISPIQKDMLEKVDTIIVDEASMVRSDMVDGMDRCLRIAFNTHMPFGGKQVVFVGDLFQLPPVVKMGSVDEEMLHDLYGSGVPFFFKAQVLKRMNLLNIEFQKVYRQSEAEFVNILNKIRIGETTSDDLKLLNQHVCKIEDLSDYSVILSAFNKRVEQINEKKLAEIDGEEFCYEGQISGSFNKGDSSAPMRLRLKVGAQVIFCRNDYSHGCVNGTIGMVKELEEDRITIRLENGTEFNVKQATWESFERVYNRETRRMESKVVGTYTQYPLRLAWAITIHKSQGMTFDRMHLDLTRGTFAPGQAYVALSRMRSLKGLTLSNAIMPHHITQNPEVRAFSNSFNNMEMIDDELNSGQLIYRYLSAKNYADATKTCLNLIVQKVGENDLRNAALLAKRMFDIMLDDDCLMGMTKDVVLLKSCNMTSNFLNAVVCLYGNRYEESIGYADMVLSRRICLEAMFIKARALYALGKYEEAYDVNYQIINATKESEDKKAVDKKQYLFEAKLNQQIGNSNIAICKQLIKICPECLRAYEMMRKSGKMIPNIKEGEGNELVLAFNDASVSDDGFNSMLKNADLESKDFLRFKRLVCRIDA